MIHSFYSNTKDEVKGIEENLIHKEADLQKLEEDHRVEIKVYIQMVLLLILFFKIVLSKIRMVL